MSTTSNGTDMLYLSEEQLNIVVSRGSASKTNNYEQLVGLAKDASLAESRAISFENEDELIEPLALEESPLQRVEVWEEIPAGSDVTPMLSEDIISDITSETVIVVNDKTEDAKVSTGAKPSIVLIKEAQEVTVYKGSLISEEESIYEPAASVDIVRVSEQSSNITVAGGSGTDIVYVHSNAGNNITVSGATGNDNMVVKGGNEQTLIGGEGNDRYILKNLLDNGHYIIDQSGSLAKDKDTLTLSNYLSSDLEVQAQETGDIVLINKNNNAQIEITQWYNRPLKYVIFKDKRISVSELAAADGVTSYRLKLKGDFIFSGTNKVKAGDCSLANTGKNDTLTVNGNDNTIYAKGGNIILVSGNNNVLLSEDLGGKITVDGGNGNKLKLGDKNSNIYLNAGENITIEGGDKQEIITINGGSNINASLGKGRDIVYAYGGTNVTLDLGASNDYNYVFCNKECENYTIEASGAQAKLIIRGGKGYVINCGDYDDDISLEGGTINSLNTGGGNNKVYMRGATLYMNGSLVNGLIFEKGANTVYLDNIISESFAAGASNDTLILNSGYIGKLRGSAGSDKYVINYLMENGSYVIDQTLVASEKENGEDIDQLVFNNYNSTDFTYTKDNAGNLLLTHTTNHAVIKVEGWTENPLQRIVFADKALQVNTINAALKDSSSSVTQQQVILDLMESLSNTVLYGTNAFNEAIVACSRGLYSSAQALLNSFKSDCLAHSGTTTSAVKKFLLNYCGINLDNADTGSIIGLDAGGATELTAASIVTEPENMTVSDLNYDFADTLMTTDYYTNTVKTYCCAKVEYKGETITIYWDERDMLSCYENGYISDVNTLKTIAAGVVKAWFTPALELIENAYGISLTGSESTLTTLSDGSRGLQLVIDYASPEVSSKYLASLGYEWVAAVSAKPSTKKVDDLTVTSSTKEALVINSYYFKNGITDIDGKGTLTTQYLDRVMAHELVHGAMASNINYANSLHCFLKEGLAELVHGIDDDRYNSILHIANNNSQLRVNGEVINQEEFLNRIFDLDTPNYKLSSYTYAASYVMLRYLAKNVSEYSQANTTSAALNAEELNTLAMAELGLQADGNEDIVLDNSSLVSVDFNNSIKLSENI